MSQNNLKPDPLSTQSEEENGFVCDTNVSKRRKLEDKEIEIKIGKLTFIFGQEGTIYTKLLDPIYFSIHPTKDIIIFCNSSNSLIQLYTLGGDYVTTFTEFTLLNPSAVTITEYFIYITSEYLFTNFLLQFSDFNFKIICFNKMTKMWNPKGLACDTQDNVYFIDEFGQHIIVYDSDMINYRKIDIGLHRDCVDLFVERDHLVLLSQSSPHISYLTLKGEFLREVNCFESLSFPHSFCSYKERSFIVSDVQYSVFKVFSFQEGIQDSSFSFSLITVDFKMPNYISFHRIAVVHNSMLIASSFDSCFSIALT